MDESTIMLWAFHVPIYLIEKANKIVKIQDLNNQISKTDPMDKYNK